jgi:hypothetical protein
MYTLVHTCTHLAVGVTFHICMESPHVKPITHLPYPQPTPLTIYLVPGGFTTRWDSGGYVVTFLCVQECVQNLYTLENIYRVLIGDAPELEKK